MTAITKSGSDSDARPRRIPGGPRKANSIHRHRGNVCGLRIELVWRRAPGGNRKALAALFKLSEKVSNRHPELTEQQLEDLLRD